MDFAGEQIGEEADQQLVVVNYAHLAAAAGQQVVQDDSAGHLVVVVHVAAVGQEQSLLV